MADQDLLEQRRGVAREPRNARARLALGLGLARSGARAEAAEAFYRARLLGAEPQVVRSALAQIQAPASPWSHLEGDAGRTRSGLVSGPRKGSVATRGQGEAPRQVVIDEDGTILGPTPARLRRYDKRHLDEVGRWGFPDEDGIVTPLVGPSGRVQAIGRGTRANGAVLMTLSADRTRFEPGPLAGSDRAFHMAADPSGLAVSVGDGLATFAPDLAPRARFQAPLSGQGFALGAGRIVLETPGPGAFRAAGSDEVRLHVVMLDLDGHELWRRPFHHSTCPPVLAPSGEVIVVAAESDDSIGPVSIRRLDALGNPVSRSALLKDVLLHPAQLGVAPDGAAYLLDVHRLTRVDPDGRTAWSRTNAQLDPDGGLVLDREGWAYAIGRHRGSGDGLCGIAPDGAVAFHVPDVTRVLALDAWGRLVALRGRELVAVE